MRHVLEFLTVLVLAAIMFGVVYAVFLVSKMGFLIFIAILSGLMIAHYGIKLNEYLWKVYDAQTRRGDDNDITCG